MSTRGKRRDCYNRQSSSATEPLNGGLSVQRNIRSKQEDPGGIIEKSSAVGSDFRCNGIEIFDFPSTHILNDLL